MFSTLCILRFIAAVRFLGHISFPSFYLFAFSTKILGAKEMLTIATPLHPHSIGSSRASR